MDSKKRSWMKSLSWRIVGIVILGLISYGITGDLTEMTIITVLFHGIRFFTYYIHERIWERVEWGKLRHPLADLPVKGELTPEDKELVRDKLKALGYID